MELRNIIRPIVQQQVMSLDPYTLDLMLNMSFEEYKEGIENWIIWTANQPLDDAQKAAINGLIVLRESAGDKLDRLNFDIVQMVAEGLSEEDIITAIIDKVDVFGKAVEALRSAAATAESEAEKEYFAERVEKLDAFEEHCKSLVNNSVVKH